MVKTARIGDTTIGNCDAHVNSPERSGTITACSVKVFAEGLGMARQGDEVTSSCGHKGFIDSGSSIMTIDGLPSARENDTFSGTYHGHITAGSAKVGTI